MFFALLHLLLANFQRLSDIVISVLIVGCYIKFSKK